MLKCIKITQDVYLDDIYPPKLTLRKPDRKSVKQIKESIKKIGLINPISCAVQRRKLILVDGLRRYLAVKEMGYPTIRAEINVFYTTKH